MGNVLLGHQNGGEIFKDAGEKMLNNLKKIRVLAYKRGSRTRVKGRVLRTQGAHILRTRDMGNVLLGQ